MENVSGSCEIYCSPLKLFLMFIMAVESLNNNANCYYFTIVVLPHQFVAKSFFVFQICFIFAVLEGPHSRIKALHVLAYLLSLDQIDVNQKNLAGNTPAHALAERGAMNPMVTWMALKLLKHCGADLNIQDDEGKRKRPR